MKKMLCLAVCVTVLMTSCNEQKEKNLQLQAQNDSLMALIAQLDGENSEAMRTINAIQAGFQRMNELQGRIDLQAKEMEGTTPSQAMLDDMEYMLKTLADYKAQIASLQAQLKRSGNKSVELSRIVENLKTELAQKEAFIADMQETLREKNVRIEQLDSEVSGLKSDVSELTSENASQAETMAAQDAALNTVYFVYGTSKELKEQNILNKGEVLASGNFNKEYFTKVDKRNITEISLYTSRSAKLLTSHPDGSYELAKNAQGLYVLHILDINTFWSVSNYLVILVK